ncbi:MAG: hypothetical protein AAFN09_17645 [Pseudomonadota bacterium]
MTDSLMFLKDIEKKNRMTNQPMFLRDIQRKTANYECMVKHDRFNFIIYYKSNNPGINPLWQRKKPVAAENRGCFLFFFVWGGGGEQIK